jgi:enoyl-CoA hydratase/carnithine racemase
LFVTLNRPESMNAMNIELRDELIETAVALDRNEAVHAVVFTGAGDKAFCAGAA